MTGAGFAAILAAVSLLTGLPITRQNGMIWGLCGFLAVTLAPAVGLPPELPGMPAADLFGAPGLVGGHHRRHRRRHLSSSPRRREAWAIALAIVLIGLPHIIGAPVAATRRKRRAAELAARFVANSIAANAMFWC